MKPEVIIQDWFVGFTCSPYDPAYAPPEVWRSALGGIVYNHPNFEDGVEIIIGNPVSFDQKERILETSNTVYKLGHISSEYAKEFEDPSSSLSVEERVFQQINKLVKTNI